MARKALIITAMICIVVAGQSPATSPTVATTPPPVSAPTSSPPVSSPAPAPTPAPAPSSATTPAPSVVGLSPAPSASDQNGAGPVGSLTKISGCFVLGWVSLRLLL